MSTFKRFDIAESSFSGPPRSAAAPYSIFIRTLTGSAKPLTVQADDTILTVKEKIFDLFGNSPATQTLMYRGKTLMDSKTLAECNIGKESIVMLISRNQEKKEAPEVAPPKPRKEPKRKIGLAKKETRNEAPAPPPPKIFILNEEKATPVTRIVAFTAYVFVQVSRQVNARFIAPTKETLFYLYSKIGRVLSLLIRYCLYIPLDKFYFSGGPIIISILDACGAFLYRLGSILRWCGAQISTGSTWCYEMSIRPTFNVICNIIKSIARNIASVANWFSRQIVSVSNGTYRAISWTTNKLATTVRWIVNRLASILNWFANQFHLGMDCLANVISTCYRFVARICSATYNAISNSANWCFSKITAAFGHLIRMFQFIGEQTIRISTTLFNNCVYNPSHFVFTNVFHMFSNLGRFVWRQLLAVCSFSNTYVLTPLENGVSSFFQCLHRGVQSFFRAIEQGLITSSQSFERVQDFTSALFDFLVTRPCTSLYNALKYSIRTASNVVSRSISNLFTQTMDFIVWFIGGVFEHSIIPLFTSGIIFAEDIVDLVLSTERLTMDILLYFYNSFKTLGNVTYRYTLVPISRWCQTAASTIYRTTKNLFSFIYRSVLVPIGNAIMTTMKTVWRFVKSNIIAFFRVFKNISSSVCSFVYRHLVSFLNSCWSGICWTYQYTVIPVGNTIKYFCTKFNAFVVHFARMIQSFLTHSASALYRGTCTTLRHTRVFCSNQLSTLARPFRASGTFLWQWAIYPSWTFFLHYLLLPYGRTVDYVAEFLWNKTRAAGSWCYSRTAAIGNSISGGLNRFLVQPLKNTYIVKTLLWVIYGEQRFIQKGLYGMDIRPAVMVKGIDTSYSLRHNQEFAVWIKNFSDELSLCTLSIGEKEIGKFKLAPTKSYLIEHSGDFVRFKFNAEIPNMTVVASFAPLSNQYPSRPVPAPNRGQTTSQTSNLEPEQKQELSGQPSWNDVMNGNVDNDIPTVEQVDSMSFDIGRGATQAFHVTTQRIQLDDSRVETISVPLRVLEV